MKKIASVFGKLSLVFICSFAANVAIAGPNSKCPVTTIPVAATSNVTTVEAYTLSFSTSLQKMYIKNATCASFVNVTITNDEGKIVYTGRINGNIGGVDTHNLGGGKYSVRLENGVTDYTYKLLLL